ncbi:MAG: hypothetical protein IPO14_06325 [Saprospiraceae bacterium]|nr:hypothetical protein [Saprospiraceae bacterium]
MDHQTIRDNSIISYLLWQQKHLGKGIDGIKSLKHLKLFVFGYSKALDDAKLENPLWYFWVWTESHLANSKDSSEDYFSYLLKSQKDDKDGLNNFFELLETFLKDFNPNDRIYLS